MGSSQICRCFGWQILLARSTFFFCPALRLDISRSIWLLGTSSLLRIVRNRLSFTPDFWAKSERVPRRSEEFWETREISSPLPR